MVQVVCQRCGASNEHERLNIAHFKLKHEKGRRSGIRIVKVASKSPKIPTPKVTETGTADVSLLMADTSATVATTTESTEQPKPKKSKRKKKSE